MSCVRWHTVLSDTCSEVLLVSFLRNNHELLVQRNSQVCTYSSGHVLTRTRLV